MDIFITLIMVLVTQVYTCVQTHQNVYINYVQGFFCIPIALLKARRKWKEKNHKKKKWKEVFVDKEEDI